MVLSSKPSDHHFFWCYYTRISIIRRKILISVIFRKLPSKKLEPLPLFCTNSTFFLFWENGLMLVLKRTSVKKQSQKWKNNWNQLSGYIFTAIWKKSKMAAISYKNWIDPSFFIQTYKCDISKFIFFQGEPKSAFKTKIWGHLNK